MDGSSEGRQPHALDGNVHGGRGPRGSRRSVDYPHRTGCAGYVALGETADTEIFLVAECSKCGVECEARTLVLLCCGWIHWSTKVGIGRSNFFPAPKKRQKTKVTARCCEGDRVIISKTQES